MSEGGGRVERRGASLLNDLHLRHDAWLRKSVRRRYGGFDPEDLVQETWLRLAGYKALVHVRHPRAFLLRIVSNLAKDRAVGSERAARLLDQSDRFGQGDHAQATQFDAVVLKELILGLPEPLRDVFLLSRLDGLTNVQIGERLGISPKTVEWRMTRALAHCAAQLRR